MSFVSIILPAYKIDFIQQAINSILNQDYKHFELIIINDGSPYNIKNIINAYNDKRIVYYENKQNIGKTNLVKHWNQCLKKAKGEYVVFASDDDIYEPNYLSSMIKLTEKYPNVNLFHCRIRYIDSNNNVIQISQPALEFESSLDFIFQRLIWRRKQALQEFFFRRQSLLQHNGFINFPTAWYTDDATWYLLSQNGVAYSKQILFNFRMSGQNISTNQSHCKEKIRAMKSFIKWLTVFLPQIKTTNEDDIFMKSYLLSNYKPIIYSHYMMYLPYLSFKDYLKEILYINKNHIFPLKTILTMTIRKFIQ